jgi:hypothetical protein
MHPIIGTCPVCGETLAVTRLHCRNCDTTIEGRFAVGAFDRLSPEHLAFAEAFIRNDGKLKSMSDDLDLSYPTLRARLDDLKRAMGFEAGGGEPLAPGLSDEERRQLLDDLATGKLSAEEAMQQLQGE